MKKSISTVLIMLIMFGSISMSISAEEIASDNSVSEEIASEAAVPVMNTYYVATDGDDENPGTIDAPFATIEAARTAIRKQKAKHGLPKGGICVYIREGTYSQLTQFKLTEEDEGTKESPITYRAYKDEKVKFVGGLPLEVKDFKRVSDTAVLNRLYDSNAREFLYQYDLSTIPDFEVAGIRYPGAFTNSTLAELNPVQHNELIVDDKVMNLARWPNADAENNGYAGVSEVVEPSKEGVAGFKFKIADSARAKNWEKSLDNLITYGYWSLTWCDSSMNIVSVEDGVIQTSHWPDRFGGPFVDVTAFYVFNLIEEIDQPGEYYIDKDTEILYFYPPEDSTRNSTIYLSTLADSMFYFDNTSYVTIRGLEIQATRGAAFKIVGGEENLVAYNDIRNIGGYGAIISGGYHNGAVGNHVIRADGGFTLSGGDTNTLTRAENYLENNHVEDFTRITKTYRGAMSVSGVGNRISHNKMHNGEHLAMQFADSYNVIEFNEMYDILNGVDDSGAIYAGASWVWRGNEIKNNYFHDMLKPGAGLHGNAGVYFDDSLAGGIVKNNIFENIYGRGIQATGWDHVWTNNIYININKEPMQLKPYQDYRTEPMYPDHQHFIDYQKHWNTFNSVPWNGELWLSHFPEMKDWDKKDMRYPERTVAKNNVMVNCGEPDFREEIVEKATAIENNISMSDPGFVDIENRDYRLKEDAAVYKQLPEFEDVHFEKMGNYDEYIMDAIKDTVVLAVDKAGAYVKGEKTQVDIENDMVFPIVENGRTLVPVRFISEAFDADVNWNEEAEEVTVGIDGKTVKMRMGSNILSIDGSNTEMDTTPVMREDRVLIPLRGLVEAIGKKVFWDNKGLIIIGNNPNVLDSTEDAYCIDELIRQVNLR